MKKPEYQEIDIPEDVMACAAEMEKVPKKYYGMQYEYEYIAYPGIWNGLLTLRFYQTEKVRDRIDGDGTAQEQEDFMLYIDTGKRSWIRHKDGKWGESTLQALYIGMDDIKLLHPEIPRSFREFDGEDIIRRIDRWQQDINREKLRKRQKRKDDRTNRLMDQAVPLSDAYIKWHEETAMKHSRYLIYKRSKKAQFPAFCTHCKNHMEIPASKCKYGKRFHCPVCGSKVTMKSHGRTGGLRDCGWTEYVQAIKDGIMIRFIRMEKDYSTYGNPERHISEPCRVVIEAGKKAEWYEIRESNTVFYSRSKYQKNNIEGCVHPVTAYPSNRQFYGVYQRGLKDQLKKGFPYHMFWEFRKKSGRTGKLKQYEIYDYFDAYSHFPLLESLQKIGYDKITDYLCEGDRRHYETFDRKAGTPFNMLKLSRQQFRRLKNPSMRQINICQELNQLGITLSQQELKQTESRLPTYDLKTELDRVLQYTSPGKFMKYILSKDKYQISMYYYDYIRMGERLGYDFTDDFVLFPRNTKEAHDTALDLIQEQKEKERMQEASENDKAIAQTEKKIRKKFSYQDDRFVIFPAKSAQEIVEEGHKQHHCVGEGNYINKIKKGISYILFMRRRENQKKPFYTVEISPEYEIIQRHGKYNKEGDEVTEVDDFLKKFVEAKKDGKEHYAKK